MRRWVALLIQHLKCQVCNGTGQVGAGRNKTTCSNCGEGEISR